MSDPRALLLRRAQLGAELAEIDRQLAACIASPSSGLSRSYSQRDGERPAGCGRVRYLRIWHVAHEARDAGATTDGRARLLTHDAYERHRPRSEAKPPRETVAAALAPLTIDDEVASELGLDPRRRIA